LALGGVDLTSPADKMTLQGIGAVAKFKMDWGRVIGEPERAQPTELFGPLRSGGVIRNHTNRRHH